MAELEKARARREEVALEQRRGSYLVIVADQLQSVLAGNHATVPSIRTMRR